MTKPIDLRRTAERIERMGFIRRAATGWFPFLLIPAGVGFAIGAAAGVGRWCVVAAVVCWSASIVLPAWAWALDDREDER